MRSISGAAATVLAGQQVPLALLLEIGASPVVRLNSSAVTLSWGGQLYYGIGTLGSVEPVVDSPRDLQGLGFVLSGVPNDVLALALADTVKGCAVLLSLAVLDPVTYAILDAPQIFAGTVDQMPINRGVESSTIGAKAVHRGETFARPKPLRNTDADQQILAPGDTSRRFVVSQAQHQDVWPAAAYFRQ